jgi:2-methylcitrate dehydratase PrpD
MSLEEELVDKAISTNYDDLPPEVVTACKKSIVDLIGVAIAGSTTPVAKKLFEVVSQWQGKPEASVFLRDTALPAHEAVFINATMGRALDFNQYHFSTGTQPPPTMVPVGLATAELCGKVSGRDFIGAVAIGSEVMCRMRMVPDYCSGLSGWVGDVCGIFGGAITAGKLMGFNSEQMFNALGLAYSQSAGNVQGVRDVGGGATLSLQQGLSARAAMLSAILGKNGLGTSKRFLDSQGGFYEVYYRGIHHDLSRLMDGFGKRYEVMNLAIKPYPSCGYTLCPIDNVLDIVKKNHLKGQEIDKIVLRVGQAAYNNVCHPRETKSRPKTVGDAMFSIPYTIGSAIFSGEVFLEDFSAEAIKDAQRLKEVDKVECLLDQDIEAEASKLSLRLSLNIAEVFTRDGKNFSQKMLHVKGSPEKPMTFAECAEKARRCAQFAGFSAEKMDMLVERIDRLEQLEDVNVITELLQ